MFAGFPILWMFFSSLKSNTEIFALPPTAPAEGVHAVAYDSIFSDPVKVRFFINSYLVAGVVTLLTVVVAILAAYGFSRYEFRFKKPLNLFMISTQTVPPITLLIPYFGMVVAFGIFDTYFALILTYMVFTLPYAILLMTGYLNTLPKELDEAVLVDGGSSWTALWRVIVPVSIPGIVATAVYTFLLSWNEFLFALTLTKSMDMQNRADRHQPADGAARVRMERDDGDERAGFAASPALLSHRPALLPRRHDRGFGEELALPARGLCRIGASAKAIGELRPGEPEEARRCGQVSARPIHSRLVGRPLQFRKGEAPVVEQLLEQRLQSACCTFAGHRRGDGKAQRAVLRSRDAKRAGHRGAWPARRLAPRASAEGFPARPPARLLSLPSDRG